MTFLHWSILFAWGAIAVPIVIHLLNRRSAKIVDWGAMQFLLGSLVSRKRRVLLDEILLLACRCLLIGLVVTALARPVIPAGSSIAWAVVLPILLLGAVAFGVGTAVWRERKWRWICYAVGAGLLALAGLTVALENVLHLGTLIGPSRDLVLVIDGSSSMTMEVDGQTNFARAVDEARDLVNALKGSATVSIVLAGPVAEVKTPVPLTDTAQLNAVLDDLKPAGGLMTVHDALRTASLVLSTATNATKQIVLLTDGQKAGWNVDDRSRWESTAQEVRAGQGSEPQVYCRVLGAPSRPRNVAVTELAATRRIIGADRPVTIRARVANPGQAPVAGFAAYLWADGKQVDRRPVGQLEPGASEVLTFLWRFDAPGSHVLEVKADVQDDLPDDNRRAIAVHVRDRLPVLLVNGRPGARPLDRASAFLRLALDPQALAREGKPPEKAAALLDVAEMDAPRLGEVQDWSKYRVVVLADVAELPPPVAERLAEFVVRGGGLWVVAGEQASAKFYNAWTATIEEEPQRLLPAALGSRVILPQDREQVRPAAGSLTHPGLQPLREGKSDLETARLSGYWRLDVGAGRAALIAGRLSDGAPWLVEHALGEGKVLLAASSLDLRDGNLPNRPAFVPLVHGLVYHLAEDAQWELNPLPGRKVTLRFPATVAMAPPVPAPPGQPPPPPSPPPRVEVAAPDGGAIEAAAKLDKGVLAVQCDHLSMPGVYRIRFPDAPENAPTIGPDRGIAVAVPADPAEAAMEWLSEADLAQVSSALNLQSLAEREDLQAIAAGRAYGVELWKSLMFLALVTVVGEVALLGWISLQRIPEAKQQVDFTHRALSTSFQEELQKLREAEDRQEPVIDLLEASERDARRSSQRHSPEDQ